METSSKSKRNRLSFTTLDIVLMAMLATANAVLTFYLSYINKMLNSLGGPVATSTIVGVYMVYGLLAYYIIRKPGTAAITYGIGGASSALWERLTASRPRSWRRFATWWRRKPFLRFRATNAGGRA